MKKIILVTGGNRGIGLEICRQLAAQGHKVIMGSRNLAAGHEAAHSLQGDIHVRQLDINDWDSIHFTNRYIDENLGRLDVLINNAGIMGSITGANDANLDEVKQVMETNFYGAWRMCLSMIPMLERSSGGRIINISSEMGAFGKLIGGYAAYRLSKVSLNGLTVLLANELAGRIAVNAVCPGWVKTDMGGQGAPRSVERGADTAVWLATEDNIPTGKFFSDRQVIEW